MTAHGASLRDKDEFVEGLPGALDPGTNYLVPYSTVFGRDSAFSFLFISVSLRVRKSTPKSSPNGSPDRSLRGPQKGSEKDHFEQQSKNQPQVRASSRKCRVGNIRSHSTSPHPSDGLRNNSSSHHCGSSFRKRGWLAQQLQLAAQAALRILNRL